MAEKRITDDQLNQILMKYSFGELVSSPIYLTNGWTNITMIFQTKPDGKKYILRQYLPGTLRNLSRENILYELNFLSFVSDELKLPVAPMIDPPGLLTIDDQTFLVFFPFIEGQKYLDTPTTPVRQLWQTISIAHFLGRMHSNIKTNLYSIVPSNRCSVNYLSVKYELVHSCDDFAEEYPQLYERIRRIVDENTRSIPLIDDEEEQILFEENLQKNLPIGYIHADIHDDNVLFSLDERKLVAVLDFDDMYVGPLLIDIALTLCLWSSIGSQFNFDYAKEFLRVYQEERQMRLTEDEWNLLEVYCYLTILNQILFVIQSEKSAKRPDEMINELLLPLESIANESERFIEKIRE